MVIAGARDRRAGRASRTARPFWALLVLLSLWPGREAAAAGAQFTHLSTEQGLSQSTVQAILQDHLGFVWLGTEEGLNRYDGHSFVVFRSEPQAPLSLPDDIVSALYEDHEKILWVGTARGLCRFDRATETFVREAAVRQRVTAIVEEPDGTLWVGTDGQGLFERPPGTQAFLSRSRNPGEPGEGIESHEVTALLRDRSGRLWVGTEEHGLYEREGTGGSRRFRSHRFLRENPNTLGHDEIWGLAEDRGQRLFIATYGGGLSVRDPRTGAFERHRHRQGERGTLPTDLLTTVFVDAQDAVWVGTDGAGLLRYDPANRRFSVHRHDPAEPGSLSDDVVRALYQDVQGQLWVGTYLGGVNLMRTPRRAFGYRTLPVSGAPSDTTVTAVLEDAEGRLWLGSGQGRLIRYSRETGTFETHQFPSTVPGGAAVLSLLQDRRGRIWAGSYRGGLGRFDPAKGAFTVYRNRPGDGQSLGNDEVWAMAEDDEGALWLGTNGQLERFDPETERVTERHDSLNSEGLANAGVRALLVDGQKNLWVGSLGGLNLRLRGGSGLVRYAHADDDPQSLSHDHVVSLREDSQGRLWAGTYGGGLNRLDQGKGSFASFKVFPSNVIYSIQEDRTGNLWVSTNHGLSRFTPRTGQVDSFDLSNGLESLQFQLGAGVRTKDGRLVFGSRDGFYDFDPQDVKPDAFAPPVRLTAMRVLSTPVKLHHPLATLDQIVLGPRDKVVSLEFSAFDYSFPKRNQYAYVLEGFSEDWTPLGGKREVTFTNLDPGSYVFRVKASNRDGVWDPSSSAAVRIVVRPAWWGTWWFRVAAVFLALLALAGAHRLRVRRLTAALGERSRAEQAVREAEEKYRSIFENALEGIYQSTPEGRFLTVNPALSRMLGFASPSAMLAEVTDIGHQLYVDPARRTEMLALLEEYGLVQDFECALKSRDGRVVWASLSVRQVRDVSGRPLYFEGVIQDVSDRWRAHQAETALRDALHKAAVEWERTFDAMEAPVLLVDGRGFIARLNRAARVLAGSSGEPGRHLSDVAPGEPWQKAAEMVGEVADRRVASHTQVRDEATGRTWDLAAGPATAGAEERVILVARDLTRVVDLQESLRRSETMSAMGALVAGVAHEVRNPLFGISANLDAFEARAGEEFKPLVSLLQREVRRLAALMQGLLDYGKPTETAPSLGDLWPAVAEAVESCEALAVSRSVKVVSESKEPLPLVLVDRKRFVQVVQNLVQNAIQHSMVGGLVTLTAGEVRGPRGDSVVLEVTDEGPGFAPDDMERIFEPFFTRRRGGTGLGLAIVQRIVVEHGGTVEVGNRPSRGAWVRVRLPVPGAR